MLSDSSIYFVNTSVKVYIMCTRLFACVIVVACLYICKTMFIKCIVVVVTGIYPNNVYCTNRQRNKIVKLNFCKRVHVILGRKNCFLLNCDKVCVTQGFNNMSRVSDKNCNTFTHNMTLFSCAVIDCFTIHCDK